MKKKSVSTKKPVIIKSRTKGINPLIAEVRRLINSTRHAIANSINSFQVHTNFEIGQRIVEHEQQGEKRAAYGTALLKELSQKLTKEFGRGFSEDNLSNMRKFFLTYKDQVSQFPRSLLGNSKSSISPAIRDISVSNPISEKPSRKLPFTLSWSHYILLLTIKETAERKFYEIESTNESWSVPELKRQKASCLYERLALSRNPAGVKRLAEKGQIIKTPEDIFKEPLVLEFLGLPDKANYSESDLESSLINHLEKFLLELGKGFLFEARQKRFTFDDDHYFLDLVFYNRLLRCYVIIDLKIDKLTHQDLGQMQMYVNWFDRNIKLPEENATIGLLVCKSKKNAIIELTLPKGANIHAREYQLYLPSKELLKNKLLEWIQEEDKTQGNL
jgi:predicted nuclease of restriction endonuclease-like (RecB) superfamily